MPEPANGMYLCRKCGAWTRASEDYECIKCGHENVAQVEKDYSKTYPICIVENCYGKRYNDYDLLCEECTKKKHKEVGFDYKWHPDKGITIDVSLQEASKPSPAKKGHFVCLICHKTIKCDTTQMRRHVFGHSRWTTTHTCTSTFFLVYGA